MKLRLENIVLTLIAFLGFGPIIYPFVKEEKKVFYTKQAMVLWGCLGIILIMIVAIAGVYSVVVIQFPDIYQQYELEGWFISISRKIFLCWLIFWFFGFIWGVLGIERGLPLVSKLIVNKFLFIFTLISNLVVMIFFILGVVLLVWSNILLNPSKELSHPVVYVLYDDLDYLPEWIFDIGFFPVIKASVDKFGRGSVALQVINKLSLAEALKHGHILLLATHGTEEGILSKGGLIKPTDVMAMERNPNLKYVYLSGCRGGAIKSSWREAFSPAEVFAYDRMTATFEHIIWFWYSAPKLIRGEKVEFSGN